MTRRKCHWNKTIVKEDVENMIRADVIMGSSSAWSFTLLISTNKDGKESFCIDYRELNQRMKSKRYTLDKTKANFDGTKGELFFSSL